MYDSLITALNDFQLKMRSGAHENLSTMVQVDNHLEGRNVVGCRAYTKLAMIIIQWARDPQYHESMNIQGKMLGRCAIRGRGT